MSADIATLILTSAGLTTATTNYTSGDQVGTEMSVGGAAQSSGKGGIIVSATLYDLAKKLDTGDFEARIFSAASTPAADNAANSWSDANAQLEVGGSPIVFRTADWKISANQSINGQGNLGIAYNCAVTTLFANFVTRQANAFFTAVTDLVLILQVMRSA